MIRQSSWGLVDQAVSSLGNTVMMILVAREVAVLEFGAFSLGLTAYMLTVGLARAVVSDPLAVRYSLLPDGPENKRAIREAVGSTCILGAIASAIVALGGVLLGGLTGSTLVALALVLPGLLIQDTWRLAFFVSSSPGRATFNDSVWVGLQILFIALLMAYGEASSGALILAWGSAGNLAAAVGYFQARLFPSFGHPYLWLKKHKDLIPSFVIENFAGSGSQQGLVYAVAAVAGLPAVAAIRAAEVLLGPLNTLYSAMRIVLLPEAVRMAHRRDGLLRTMARLSVVLALCSAGWGVALFILPDRLGESLLGESWRASRSVLIPMTTFKVLTASSAGAIIGLRALAIARRSAAVRVVMGVATLLVGSVGAWRFGAEGAAAGMAIVAGIAGLVWWDQFLKASRVSLRP